MSAIPLDSRNASFLFRVLSVIERAFHSGAVPLPTPPGATLISWEIESIDGWKVIARSEDTGVAGDRPILRLEVWVWASKLDDSTPNDRTFHNWDIWYMRDSKTDFVRLDRFLADCVGAQIRLPAYLPIHDLPEL